MATISAASPYTQLPGTNGAGGSLSEHEGREGPPDQEAHDPASDKVPIIEDDEYFLRSIFVFFQVENTLFHVPSYRFTDESQIFAEMFKVPKENTANAERASRELPIILPDSISRTDFRNFLKALYPLPVVITLSLSKDEWLSVLKLSSLWYFLSFRDMAIAELECPEALTPTEKVTWGRDVKISSWVVKGYQEIVQRSTIISKDEALAIGYETTFSLFKLREQRLQASTRCTSFAVDTSVKEAFKDELENIRAEERGYAVKTEAAETAPAAKEAEHSAGACSCQGFFGEANVPPSPAPAKKAVGVAKKGKGSSSSW
ncbi:unnamed protein product [Cyclocybe aegerita]|uniref:BTB domain-containing protein n=1 Tax=Cyclocybe aegerita TaxID=1973307 RepID=A0A8S0VTI0_CYCAE|nr:unnamed protein product [Cyclocybe aegerita]